VSCDFIDGCHFVDFEWPWLVEVIETDPAQLIDRSLEIDKFTRVTPLSHCGNRSCALIAIGVVV